MSYGVCHCVVGPPANGRCGACGAYGPTIPWQYPPLPVRPFPGPLPQPPMPTPTPQPEPYPRPPIPVPVEPLTEEQIREIVREEIQKNGSSSD